MLPLPTRETMFGLVLKSAAALLLTVFCHQVAFATDDLIITGKVTDGTGKPIADAAVMVYHAGPTTGYRLFCPSCYTDCGKRAITDTNGMFSFHHLSAGLWFELLVARTGYEPKFIEKVVPSSNTPATATLEARPRIGDPSRMFRGRIVDSNGLAQHDAVVQLVGESWVTKTGTHSSYHFGAAFPGLDPIAVTDSKGVFEIDSFPAKPSETPFATSGPPLEVLVSAEARGRANVVSVIPAGVEPHTITVDDGALVRGRLIPSDFINQWCSEIAHSPVYAYCSRDAICSLRRPVSSGPGR